MSQTPPDPPAAAPSSPSDALSPVERWRRRIVKSIDRILEACAQTGAGGELDAENVLRARRAAKRLRALALMAPPEHAALARKSVRRANKVRRALGPAREAQAREKLLAELGLKMRAPLAPAPSAPPGDSLRKLGRLREKWLRRDLSSLKDDDLFAGLREDYRKTRERAGAAADDRAALHRWRRAAVDLEYSARLMAPFAPELDRWAREADDLRRRLGDALDMAEALADGSRAHAPAPGKDAGRGRGGKRGKAKKGADTRPEAPDAALALSAAARAQAKRRRDEDIAAAHALGARLFAQKPRDWLASVVATKPEPAPGASGAQEQSPPAEAAQTPPGTNGAGD